MGVPGPAASTARCYVRSVGGVGDLRDGSGQASTRQICFPPRGDLQYPHIGRPVDPWTKGRGRGDSSPAESSRPGRPDKAPRKRSPVLLLELRRSETVPDTVLSPGGARSCSARLYRPGRCKANVGAAGTGVQAEKRMVQRVVRHTVALVRQCHETQGSTQWLLRSRCQPITGFVA